MLYQNQFSYNHNFPQQKSVEDMVYTQPYQTFEYINFNVDASQDQFTVIEVVDCIGSSNLLASPSYSDIKTGKLTRISSQDLWSNNGITAGLVDVTHGYYYIGVMNSIKNSTLYTVRLSEAFTIKGEPYILHRLWL